MKHLYIIIFVFLVNITLAQPNKAYFNISYGKVIYPFYNYDLNKNDGSYTLGFNISYFFAEKTGILTGLYYEQKNFLIDYETNGINGWETDIESFNFEYLQIPLQVRYVFVDIKKSIFLLKAGVDFGFLLSKNCNKVMYNGSIENCTDNYEFDKNIHNLILGFDYNYSVYKDISINLCSEIRYNTTTNEGIHGDSGQGTELSYIFEVGVNYKLVRD